MERLLLAVLVVVGVPAATAGYIIIAERLLGFLPDRHRPGIRPWLWVAPAVVLLFIFLVYPTIQTIFISF
ncbi:MAG TPA: sugar ABC transporter permease, partial [Chloroflexota bacterium]|nr:sugar ABC transporter permease [Chloroflexota bacterium]